jgi:hypothetical protein
LNRKPHNKILPRASLMIFAPCCAEIGRGWRRWCRRLDGNEQLRPSQQVQLEKTLSPGVESDRCSEESLARNSSVIRSKANSAVTRHSWGRKCRQDLVELRVLEWAWMSWKQSRPEMSNRGEKHSPQKNSSNPHRKIRQKPPKIPSVGSRPFPSSKTARSRLQNPIERKADKCRKHCSLPN